MLLFGPPLAKVRSPRLIAERTVSLVRVEPGLALALVDRADVLSEGRDDAGRYFGTSSVAVDAADPAVARALSTDLHVRTAVLRIARREASSRSNGPLGTLSCHVSCRIDGARLIFDVEVEAALDAPRAAFA